MRIPLDYYKILGLPIQASVEQMQQAYRDRVQQLPRREYSEAAIAARKQLIEEAYSILSDSEQRHRYNANYFAHAYEQERGKSHEYTAEEPSGFVSPTIDPHTPSINIADDLFVGALLILQELGEYELVFNLGGSYLSTARISLPSQEKRSSNPVLSDIVLTVTLACLELGREQWQQRQYENAAASLEIGQEILLREKLFPGVLEEIRGELYKLRPYRIWQLISQGEENTEQRRQGLKLLQDILQQRGGIDGTNDDGSGLSLDNFLRFIEQLREYLTASEQKELFVAESQRPSAVATYLAAYALLAQGFAQRQPALIRQAKLLLTRLGKHQDLHLEQAVCSLLLGQTEAASYALERSQEYEPLALIREHSQGSPDLLPGLCLYSERWLQTEVFPHFRDLAAIRISLKDYFADKQVQSYLEALFTEVEQSDKSTMVPSNSPTYTQERHSSKSTESALVSTSPSKTQRDKRTRSNSRIEERHVSSSVAKQQAVGAYSNSPSSPTATTTVNGTPAGGALRSAVGTAAAIANQNSTGTATTLAPEAKPAPSRLKRRRRSRLFGGLSIKAIAQKLFHRQGSSSTKAIGNIPNFKRRRLVMLAAGGVLGVVVLGQTLSWFRQTPSTSPSLPDKRLAIVLNQPLLPIPAPKSKLLAVTGPLTKETAEKLIQTWLSTKSAAFGQNHAVDSLKQVLVTPTLTHWQKLVQKDKAINQYRQYKHSLKLESVQTNAAAPNKATVTATVTEVAQIYRNSRLNQNSSYNEKLRVRYYLVRKDGQWRIQEMDVINS